MLLRTGYYKIFGYLLFYLNIYKLQKCETLVAVYSFFIKRYIVMHWYTFTTKCSIRCSHEQKDLLLLILCMYVFMRICCAKDIFWKGRAKNADTYCTTTWETLLLLPYFEFEWKFARKFVLCGLKLELRRPPYGTLLCFHIY